MELDRLSVGVGEVDVSKHVIHSLLVVPGDPLLAPEVELGHHPPLQLLLKGLLVIIEEEGHSSYCLPVSLKLVIFWRHPLPFVGSDHCA